MVVQVELAKEVEGLEERLRSRVGWGLPVAIEPPELPDRMSPGQAAQLAELIEYIHIRVRNLLNSVETEGKGEQVKLDLHQWQNLLDLQSRLAEYLRAVSGPHD